MKKILISSLVLMLGLAVLTGCGGDKPAATDDQGKNKADVVTTASMMTKEDAFVKAISEDGTWIVIPLNDLKFDKELVVEGTFHNKGDATKDVYRKLAPYTQDDERNVTARFTITAPKMTIKSPNTKLQGGTFVGDVYVEANGFIIQDAKVDGNVYFATEKYEESFDMSKAGVVTGTTEVKTEVDTVAAASMMTKEADFIKAISKEGTWIVIPLNDLSFDKELVVEGTFHNKGDANQNVYRKLAPYTQDAKRNVTARFTITAPKMTIKSPNTKLQGGIFVGDVYVEANGFTIQDAKVDGNVYFATKEYEESFDMSKAGVVTGTTEVK